MVKKKEKIEKQIEEKEIVGKKDLEPEEVSEGPKQSSAKKEYDFGIDLKEMLEAGVYFGHKTSKTHPKMKPFIHGIRNTIHVMDLQKTAERLEKALICLKELASKKGTVLFVGTTPSAREIVKEVARELSMPYVDTRWLGGTLTNFPTISKRLKYFHDLENKEKQGELKKYTKKEQLKFKEELRSLEQKMGGIKNMDKLPDLVFVVDLRKDYLAVHEAKMKGILTMAFCDTNVDPSLVDYPIPANDDAISSVRYILGKVREALKQK